MSSMSSPYLSNNNRYRTGLFDRGTIVSASALRSSSMPATRNNNNTASSASRLAAPTASTLAKNNSSNNFTRTGSALRRPSSSSSRPNSTNSSGGAGFLSHTVGRAADRNRLLNSNSNSPMQANGGGSSSPPASSPTASKAQAVANTMPSLSGSESPVRSIARSSPSRGLFSPVSDSVLSPGGGGSSVGSPSPARSDFSLPSPSATPVTHSPPNNSNNTAPGSRGAGLVYAQPFDYSSTSNRFGLPPATRGASSVANNANNNISKPSARVGGVGGGHQHHHHHHHHNSKFLLPTLRSKALSVVTETTELVAKERAAASAAIAKSNGLARSPSNDDLGIELDSNNNNNNGGAGGIVFSPTSHCVIFDLDETLCCNRGPGRAILRPGAVDLLRELAHHRDQLSRSTGGQRTVEIVLWTASMDDVAMPVVDRLDPDGTIFDHLIFRDHRWFKNESNYTKDLRLLGRDMAGCCIVENSPVSVRLNRQHSILVKDFMGMSYRDTDLFAVRDVLLSWINGDKFSPIDRHLTAHPLMCSRTNNVKPGVGGGGGGGIRSSYF